MLLEVKEEYRKSIIEPKIAAEIFRNILSLENEIDQNKEHFWAIGLNARNIVLYIELITLGTLTHSLVHPREVFRMAIIKAAASITIGHNHPSGNPEPSMDDIMITERLKHAGEIIGIGVMDHIVIGNNNSRYVSFRYDRYEVWNKEKVNIHQSEDPGHHQNILKNKKLEKAIKSDKKIQNALKEMNEAASQLLTIRLS
jgi:DNA repair protein RadC